MQRPHDLTIIILDIQETSVHTEMHTWMFVASLSDPKIGNNPDILQCLNGDINCCTSIQWNTSK